MEKYKIIDYFPYGNIVELKLGDLSLKEWSGPNWDSKDFSQVLLVDEQYVKKTIQLVVNPKKLSVVYLEDLDYLGRVTFEKRSDLKHPIFAIVKNIDGTPPEDRFWDSDSRHYFMGQEIEIDETKKFIAIGY